MSQHKPRLSVVIPAYGPSLWLEACLDHLSRQTRPADEIIVFHTGSDNPEPRLSPLFPGVRIVHQDAREFAGGARNRGAALAGGDWLVFLDCDMLAGPDWLAGFEAAMLADRGDVLVGSIGCGPSGGLWGRAMWFLECGVVFPHRRPRELIAANGANVAVRKALFDASCRFRADLFAGEDVDLMVQLGRRGARIRFEPEASADHMFGGGMAATLKRAGQLGQAAAFVRRNADLPGGSVVRHPWLAAALPPVRLAQMAKRLVLEGGPVLQFLALSPAITALLVAWAWGFYREARAPTYPVAAAA